MKAFRLGLLLLPLLALACGGNAQVESCDVSADCTSGACEAGLCVARPIGDACTAPADCGDEGGVCNLSLPGGYCTDTCESAADCPSGSTCLVSGGEGYCYEACNGDESCREGYVCSSGVCQTGCTEDAECLGGEVCRNAHCIGSGAGDACESPDDCTSTLTCVDGACTKDCTSDGQCPVGSTCETEGTEQRCVAVCRSDVDCGDTELCLLGGCVDRCTTDAFCGAGRACNLETGVCFREGGGAGSTVLELGAVSPNTPITFEVPAGTFAITIHVQGSPSTQFEFTSVKNPEGTELYHASSNGMSQPLRVMPWKEIVSAQIPNSDDPVLAPLPGTWTFSFSGGPAEATVVLKSSADGQSLGGVVDLNVFLSPNAFGVDAAGAPGHTVLQETLAYWEETYEPHADIVRGAVRYFDIDAKYDDIAMDLFGGDSEQDEMWARYGRDDGLNVFFVRSIGSGMSAGVAGVSGGIPGPALTAGTQRSGIVIEVQETALLTGIDWCHEAGHFQGLFHTSEFDYFGMGQIHDELSDTPECAPPDGGCTASKQHLMFPALDPAMHLFSPASAEVLRANAGVR